MKKPRAEILSAAVLHSGVTALLFCGHCRYRFCIERDEQL